MNRPQDYQHETNDCTVAALKEVLGCTYQEAHGLLAAAGREDGKRFRFRDFMYRRGTIQGRRVEKVRAFKRRYVENFAADNPSGVFICAVYRHCLAIIDGSVRDEFASKEGRKIIDAWRIF